MRAMRYFKPLHALKHAEHIYLAAYAGAKAAGPLQAILSDICGQFRIVPGLFCLSYGRHALYNYFILRSKAGETKARIYPAAHIFRRKKTPGQQIAAPQSSLTKQIFSI
jgi:hypothetical protein